jgi:2-methylcitrate dehydratase PrpD
MSEAPREKGTAVLAAYAAGLRYEELPADVIQRAKDCLIDTVAVVIFGYRFPWSQKIVAYAAARGSGGRSCILGHGNGMVQAPFAALANGALAHAFEFDCTTRPSAGAHPGAIVATSALAFAQELGLGGKDLIVALVAGTEVMIRVGRAAKNTIESKGFHAPGVTGPFGAVAACGRLLGLDAERMTSAFGIAGSFSSGLLEFESGTGAMVKRLHFARAAEGGVVAAQLAADGFSGPNSVLEGHHGLLHVFCEDSAVGELTRDLGRDYRTLGIAMKRYACHSTAQTPIQAALDLQQEHRIKATDVTSIEVLGSEKLLAGHGEQAPADIMMGQYSVAFCVALSFCRNPLDPGVFTDEAVRDPDILSLASRTTLAIDPGLSDPASREATVRINLKSGRTVSKHVANVKGTPDLPLNQTELREKFMLLTSQYEASRMGGLFDRLQGLESEEQLSWLTV